MGRFVFPEDAAVGKRRHGVMCSDLLVPSQVARRTGHSRLLLLLLLLLLPSDAVLV